MYIGQIASYQSVPAGSAGGGYNSSLIYYLATYLGVPAPDSQLRFAEAFVCPGFQKFTKSSDFQTPATWATNDMYAVPNVGTSDGKGGSDVWGPGIPPTGIIAQWSAIWLSERIADPQDLSNQCGPAIDRRLGFRRHGSTSLWQRPVGFIAQNTAARKRAQLFISRWSYHDPKSGCRLLVMYANTTFGVFAE